ncbi:MAG: tRNA 2-selenouridine(34) synthase MnmH [Ferruginibacter sp.]
MRLAETNPVFDVRSPGEYTHAHIPGAHSLPIFSDEERKAIGTTYKQSSREKAIKEGLEFFGSRMKDLVEQAEAALRQELSNKKGGQKPKLLIHCWRGGMRSNAVAWLLDLYGFECYLLEGGYKSYRNLALQQFEKPIDLQLLGGYTGSGKTEVLEQLSAKGLPIIDLEKIAKHRGSAFGGIGQPEQPSQEMFENLLALELMQLSTQDTMFPVWVEDESQRIGKLNIPHAFWKIMRESPVHFLDIPFEERLKHILSGYQNLDKESLAEAITRIAKRLGPLETKTALAHLAENDFKSCFDILLQYYDKTYRKSLLNRENTDELLNKIPCLSVDTYANIEKLDICRLQSK